MRQQCRWWAGMGIILLVAAALRFTGYGFGLPYYDHIDEPWLFYEAAFQRGLLSWWEHPNPSPGLISVYKLAQVVSEAITHQTALAHVPDIIFAMRFVSVIVSLMTLVIIGLCARTLADDKAGWLAAAIWTVIPLVIYHSFIAIAEPWMMLFAALSLYAAVVTLRRDGRDSVGWPLLSVWAGLLAFAFKYSMFPFAGIGLVAVLWQWWVKPAQRRQKIKVMSLQLVSIVVFLAALALVAGLAKDVGSPSREVAQFLQNPLARLSDLGNVIGVAVYAFWQFGMAPLAFALIYVAAMIVLVRKQDQLQNPRLAGWLLLGALGSFSALLVPLYLVTDTTLPRYLFAASLTFVILAASSLSVLYDAMYALPSIHKHRIIFATASLTLIIVWLGPLTRQAGAEAHERLKPYTLTDMTVWASYSLGAGSIMTEGAGHRAFSREMGGYTGLPRNWAYRVSLLTRPLDEWHRQGYQYIELVQDYEQQLLQTAEGRAYFSQITELRRFPPPESKESWTGPAFVVYQLSRPEAAKDITFGGTFHLIGSDGVQASVSPGETLMMRFYWHAQHKPTDNYSLFVHLEPAYDEQLLAQADGAPGPSGRPTLTWDIPSETLVSDTFTVKIPDNLVGGTYRLLIGMYDPATGQRLATPQGTEALLTKLSVSDTF